MFLGKHSITLDKTDRFQLPASVARELSGGFFIAQGFDRNLWMLTPQAFEAVHEKLRSLNLADPLVRMLVRMLLSSAQEVKVGRDGMVPVSPELKRFAHLRRTILLVGQGDYLEIWDPVHWDKQDLQLKDAKANASRFSSLSIVTN